MWHEIDSFPWPTDEWSYDSPDYLLWDGKQVVVGRCVLQDIEEKEYRFDHGDGFECHPTHWMPLPEPPTSRRTKKCCHGK